jgi:outer membrane cobalamin receptor
MGVLVRRGRFLVACSVLALWWSSAASAATDGASAATADASTSADAHATGAGDVAIVDEVTVTGRRLTTAAGPNVSAGGANDYAVTSEDIANLPTGGTTPMTDVLAQMPGVAIDQNQQIHIRNTEGPQFQYQINGVLVPLDINTNPPFLSMINPQFVKQLDLLDGILPARYSFATGGVVDIQTKDGCEQPGASFTLLGGQRDVVQPSGQYGGCAGKFSYYVSGLYNQGNNAFSSATPGADPIHDFTHQGQAFGFFAYQIDPNTKLSLMLSAAASNNQLPNVPGLAPAFTLAGVPTFQSVNINSNLDFRDYLAVLALNGSTDDGLHYQLAYSAHYISQEFRPDAAGELIFQGVASTASHHDVDNTFEGDATKQIGDHTLGAGFYVGDYMVTVGDSSLVFPVDINGDQSSTTPIRVINNNRATNILAGVYLNDLWQLTDQLRANIGMRFDSLSGFTNHQQVDPTFNLTYVLSPQTTFHGGFARYMQEPSFQGISPTAPAAFAGTTAEGPPGTPNPLTEDDYEWDVGVVHHLTPRVTVSEDSFYEITRHYLDTGQFGDVAIFAPFNYQHGHIWGAEFAVDYRGDHLSAYANLTLGENFQTGVATGQFNFDADELAFINTHTIPLDHQPLAGISTGATYSWRAWRISLDGIYSSGLRGGFADQTQLPNVVQVNASVQRAFEIPVIGRVIDRLTFLNVFDRVNLIRPSEGIGIFQSAYGPRFTVMDSLTIAF